jgi:hypothetical protein
VVSFTPLPLYARGNNPSTHWIGGWVGPAVGLKLWSKKKISCHSHESNPGHATPQKSLLNYPHTHTHRETHFLIRRFKCCVPSIVMYKYAIGCVKQLNLTVVSARPRGFVAVGMITRGTASSALQIVTSDPALRGTQPRVKSLYVHISAVHCSSEH